MGRKLNQNGIARVALIVLLAPLIALIIPLAIVAIACRLIYGASLVAIVWLVWCAQGVDTLVVYSNSPNWHDYMAQSVLPRLEGRSVVLNWSERRQWKWHCLSVAAFQYFSGDRQFNPIVIAFRPFRYPRTFRFWQAFHDLKHGNDRTLRDIENRMYTYLKLDMTRDVG